MTALLIAVALTSFVIYGHAIQRLFSRSHGIARSMRALQLLGTLSAFLHLWCLWKAANDFDSRPMIGLMLYVAGLSVFYAAEQSLSGRRLTLAFSADAPLQLIDTGIYSRVRHPFYLAYSLTWLGGAIAAPSLLTIVSSTVMIAFYIAAAVVEEKKFAQSKLGNAYALYRTRAGMLWPGLK